MENEKMRSRKEIEKMLENCKKLRDTDEWNDETSKIQDELNNLCNCRVCCECTTYTVLKWILNEKDEDDD